LFNLVIENKVLNNSNSVVKGVMWSAIDRIAVVALQLIIEVVLARLLLPTDYGIIGMVAIFFAVAQVFVESGFMNALIQKQDRTETDYSTVFFISLLLSIFIYFLLFLLAPYIAAFYKVEMLTSIIRILGTSIIINSLAIVFRTKLSILMDFKVQAKLSVISVCISGVLGIFLAYHGYGVWALVYQSICLYTLNTLFLALNLKWKPLFVFSKDSFTKLFGFGSKLLLAGLIQNIYSNLYSVLIGKVFPTRELGLYSKSTQFTLYPSNIITNMFQRVMYPYLSKYQDDNAQLFILNKQYYRVISMVFFPLFVGLGVLAEPFVKVLLSDKWIDAVPLIRILAIAYLFFPFININMFVFQIKGKTSQFLLIEILTKISGVLILIFTLKFGVLIMCYGLLFQHIIQLCITSYYSDKAMNSSVFSQIRSLIPLIIVSVVFSIITLIVIQLISISIFKLLVGALVLLILYIGYYYFLMNKELKLIAGYFNKK